MALISPLHGEVDNSIGSGGQTHLDQVEMLVLISYHEQVTTDYLY